MKSRQLTVGVLAVVLVLALWWMLIYRNIQAQANDASEEVEQVKAETETLTRQRDALAALEARAPEIQAQLDQLRAKVPQDAQLAQFIDQAEQIGEETGVKWVSVTPSEPSATGTIGTIQMTIQVEGSYPSVRNYLKRMEELPRLVIVDAISVDKGSSSVQGEKPDPLGPPTLTATLTARMFTQEVALQAPVAASPDAATTPTTAGAPAEPQVQGGGGVAATPAATEN